MKPHTIRRWHAVCRAVIIGGLACYMLDLMRIDKLHYYIAPRMVPAVKWAAAGLLLLALYLLYDALRAPNGKQEEDGCGCGHDHAPAGGKSYGWYALFVLPLVLGIALPDQSMASDAAARKGMNLQASTAASLTVGRGEELPRPAGSTSVASNNDGAQLSAGDAQQPAASQPTASSASVSNPGAPPDEAGDGRPLADRDEPYADNVLPLEGKGDIAQLAQRIARTDPLVVPEDGFLEVITVLDLYKEHYEGKTVQLSGFVYREKEMADDQFVVARMAMQCCSADALPYGFLVERKEGDNLPTDRWVTVTGTVAYTSYMDTKMIQLNASSVQLIAEPDEPYVYPYFGAYKTLIPTP